MTPTIVIDLSSLNHPIVQRTPLMYKSILVGELEKDAHQLTIHVWGSRVLLTGDLTVSACVLRVSEKVVLRGNLNVRQHLHAQLGALQVKGQLACSAGLLEIAAGFRVDAKAAVSVGSSPDTIACDALVGSIHAAYILSDGCLQLQSVKVVANTVTGAELHIVNSQLNVSAFFSLLNSNTTHHICGSHVRGGTLLIEAPLQCERSHFLFADIQWGPTDQNALLLTYDQVTIQAQTATLYPYVQLQLDEVVMQIDRFLVEGRVNLQKKSQLISREAISNQGKFCVMDSHVFASNYTNHPKSVFLMTASSQLHVEELLTLMGFAQLDESVMRANMAWHQADSETALMNQSVLEAKFWRIDESATVSMTHSVSAFEESILNGTVLCDVASLTMNRLFEQAGHISLTNAEVIVSRDVYGSGEWRLQHATLQSQTAHFEGNLTTESDSLLAIPTLSLSGTSHLHQTQIHASDQLRLRGVSHNWSHMQITAGTVHCAAEQQSMTDSNGTWHDVFIVGNCKMERVYATVQETLSVASSGQWEAAAGGIQASAITLHGRATWRQQQIVRATQTVTLHCDGILRSEEACLWAEQAIAIESHAAVQGTQLALKTPYCVNAGNIALDTLLQVDTDYFINGGTVSSQQQLQIEANRLVLNCFGSIQAPETHILTVWCQNVVGRIRGYQTLDVMSWIQGNLLGLFSGYMLRLNAVGQFNAGLVLPEFPRDYRRLFSWDHAVFVAKMLFCQVYPQWTSLVNVAFLLYTRRGALAALYNLPLRRMPAFLYVQWQRLSQCGLKDMLPVVLSVKGIAQSVKMSSQLWTFPSIPERQFFSWKKTAYNAIGLVGPSVNTLSCMTWNVGIIGSINVFDETLYVVNSGVEGGLLTLNRYAYWMENDGLSAGRTISHYGVTYYNHGYVYASNGLQTQVDVMMLAANSHMMCYQDLALSARYFSNSGYFVGEEGYVAADHMDLTASGQFQLRHVQVTCQGKVYLAGQIQYQGYLGLQSVNASIHTTEQSMIRVQAVGQDNVLMMAAQTEDLNGRMQVDRIILDITHFDAAEACVKKQGRFAQLEVSDRLTIHTQDALSIAGEINRSCGLEVKAGEIAWKASYHTENDLVLISTSGGVQLYGDVQARRVFVDTKTYLHTTGKVQGLEVVCFCAEGDYLNAGGRIEAPVVCCVAASIKNIAKNSAAYETLSKTLAAEWGQEGVISGGRVFLEATVGNIENHAGILQGGQSLQILAAKDLVNQCGAQYQKDVGYQRGMILGGTGIDDTTPGCYIKVGGKVDNIGSTIGSEGDNYIEAPEGVDTRGVVYTETRGESGMRWYGTKTRSTTTHTVQPAAITSLKGGTKIVIEKGEMKSAATLFATEKGTKVYAKKDVKLLGYKTKEMSSTQRKGLGGVINVTRHQSHEQMTPTVIEDSGVSRLESMDENVLVKDTVISGGGTLEISAKKGSARFESTPLTHEIKEKKRGLGAKVQAGPLVQALNTQQRLAYFEPTFYYGHALLNANNMPSFASSAWNMGVSAVNSAQAIQAAHTARTMDTLLQERLGIQALLNPALNLTYTTTRSHRTYQTPGCGIIQKDKVVVEVGDTFALIGVDCTVGGDMYVDAKKFEQTGVALHASISSCTTAVSLNTQSIAGVSHTESYQQITQYHPQRLYVEGTLHLKVDEWTLQSAEAEVGELAGHVHAAHIVSQQDTYRMGSHAVSVGNTGHVAVSKTAAEGAYVGTASGVHVRAGINHDHEHAFTLDTLHLVGGHFTTEGVNNLQDCQITTQEVHDYETTMNKGFSGNLQDLLPNQDTPHDVNLIRTVNVNYGHHERRATHWGTVFGAVKTVVDEAHITGSLNTADAVGYTVTYDRQQQMEVLVPTHNPFTLFQQRAPKPAVSVLALPEIEALIQQYIEVLQADPELQEALLAEEHHTDFEQWGTGLLFESGGLACAKGGKYLTKRMLAQFLAKRIWILNGVTAYCYFSGYAYKAMAHAYADPNEYAAIKAFLKMNHFLLGPAEFLFAMDVLNYAASQGIVWYDQHPNLFIRPEVWKQYGDDRDFYLQNSELFERESMIEAYAALQGLRQLAQGMLLPTNMIVTLIYQVGIVSGRRCLPSLQMPPLPAVCFQYSNSNADPITHPELVQREALLEAWGTVRCVQALGKLSMLPVRMVEDAIHRFFNPVVHAQPTEVHAEHQTQLGIGK